MTNLLDLADRLESLQNANRDIDVEIVRALHPDIGPYAPHCEGDEPIFYHDPYRKQPAPTFTASLDAAIKLVPEGFAWALATHGIEKIRYWASVSFPDEEAASYQGLSASPSLALLAACLRSIHSDEAGR